MSFDFALDQAPPRRRPARDSSALEATQDVRNSVAAHATRDAGAPLDGHTRASMEQRFGRDFGDVRVHADDRAAASARGIEADAYSYGRHVVFGAGRYAPGTSTGERLLAHELAHVAQSAPDAAGGASAPEAALEHEAHGAADAVMSGRAPEIQHRTAQPQTLRQAATDVPDKAPAAPPKPAKPKREVFKDVGRKKNMDAELDREAGWLTLQMRVKFIASNRLQPWPSKERFAKFTTEFVRTVQQRWSFKHYLVQRTPCEGEPARAAVRVQIIPVESGEQATADVAYTDERPQSSVQGNKATLDVQDTERRSDFPQTPAEHEFGHMIGLPHIECSRNDDKCYGVTREQKADVMGKGSFVSPRAYEVFAEVMSFITKCVYAVLPASQIPTSRAPGIGGGIGALVGALGLGAAGMAIGASFGPIGALVGGLIGLVAGGIGGFFAGRAIATPEVPS
jgi:hypothetical protein